MTVAVDRDGARERRGRSGRLRVRLALVVVASLLPAALLVIHSADTQRRSEVEHMRGELRRLTQLASSRHERLIASARALLVSLSAAPVVSEAAPECDRVLADLLPRFPGFVNLGVADHPSGDVTCSALPLPGSVNVIDRAYFKDAVSTGGFSIGTYQVGRITGVPSINFGYPVRDRAGAITHVAFAALDLGWMSEFAAQAELPPDGAITVFDADGVVLARHPADPGLVGSAFADAPLIIAAHARPSDVAEIEGLDGVDRLYGFAPLSGQTAPAAYLSVGMPVETAFRSAFSGLRRDLALLAVAMAVGLAVSFAVARSMVLRPVERLVTATERLRDGDLSARASLAVSGELADLGAAFDEMAGALETRTADLVSSVKRLENLWAVDKAILEASSPEEVAAHTFERLRACIPFDRASLVLFDLASEVAHFIAVDDRTGRGPEAGTVLALDRLSADPELLSGEPFFVEDLLENAQEPPLLTDLAERGIRSTMGFPLRVGDEVIGRVTLSAGEPRAFDGEHRAIGREVSDQLAIAVTQTRLRRELSERAEELEKRLEELRRTDEHRRRLLGELVSAQEEERRRIADDIHDDSVQVMTAVGIRLGTLKKKMADPELEDAVDTLAHTVETAIARLRALLFELAPPVLERDGLAAAVRSLLDHPIEAVGDRRHLDLRLENRLSEEPPYETRVIAYRLIHAAVANARAHARARSVTVSLEPRDDGLRVVVRDDGVGFDPTATGQVRPGHRGLASMRQRAEAGGGWLRVDSAPGRGTTVVFWLPLLSVRQP